MLHLCTYLVAHDGAADRVEAHLRAIGVRDVRSISHASGSKHSNSSAGQTDTQQQNERCTYERGTAAYLSHFLLVCPLQPSEPSFAAHEYVLAQLTARAGAGDATTGGLARTVREQKSWLDDELGAPVPLPLAGKGAGAGAHGQPGGMQLHARPPSLLDAVIARRQRAERARRDGEGAGPGGSLSGTGAGGEHTDMPWQLGSDMLGLTRSGAAVLPPGSAAAGAGRAGKPPSAAQDAPAPAPGQETPGALAERARVFGSLSLAAVLRASAAAGTHPRRGGAAASSSPSSSPPASAPAGAPAGEPAPAPQARSRRRERDPLASRLNTARKRWDAALPLLRLARAGRGAQLAALCALLGVEHELAPAERTAKLRHIAAAALGADRDAADGAGAADGNARGRRRSAKPWPVLAPMPMPMHFSRRRARPSSSSSSSAARKRDRASQSDGAQAMRDELEAALDALDEALAPRLPCAGLAAARAHAAQLAREELWTDAARRAERAEARADLSAEAEAESQSESGAEAHEQAREVKPWRRARL